MHNIQTLHPRDVGFHALGAAAAITGTYLGVIASGLL